MAEKWYPGKFIERLTSKIKGQEVYTPKEFRGLLAAHVEAIDTCIYRIRDHLKSGLPLDRELIKKEVESIKDWSESILKEMEKVVW
jgi:hypothetical protein